MSPELERVIAHLDGASVLSCGHTIAGLEPLSGAVFCEQCALHRRAALDQELTAATNAAPPRAPESP